MFALLCGLELQRTSRETHSVQYRKIWQMDKVSCDMYEHAGLGQLAGTFIHIQVKKFARALGAQGFPILL